MEMPMRPRMLGWAKAGKWAVAGLSFTICSYHGRSLTIGFRDIGERGGLGVFLVGRRSDIDLHVPASA